MSKKITKHSGKKNADIFFSLLLFRHHFYHRLYHCH
ncbi:hypothetical protein BpHYR1_016110 [Brachionus plicatilis]|uniref:Uncharacterized protein n=1 Tax=Brachionus plicatilis TaxID=10195 RepID=A0A3M7P590_BRAPC|nr:hypothetical protein BpHYR1_016110 [Brachionus plicatilis]